MIGRSVPVARRRDDDRAGEQLLRRERHRQDVVDAEVERPQLRLEVAAPGQARGPASRAPVRRVRGAQPPEQGGAVVVVHVDHGQVRPPFGQDRSAVARLVAARTTNRPWLSVSSMRSTTSGRSWSTSARRGTSLAVTSDVCSWNAHGAASRSRRYSNSARIAISRADVLSCKGDRSPAATAATPRRAGRAYDSTRPARRTPARNPRYAVTASGPPWRTVRSPSRSASGTIAA